MLHKMKLKESPFERIKSGKKSVEFRLFDEKRRKIKIGDKIEFSKLPDLQEKLVVDVIDLYRDETFNSLFKKLFTDNQEIERKTKSMLNYYTHDEEVKYGVLGIKIKIDTTKLKNQIQSYIPFNEQEEVEKKIILKHFDDEDDVLTRANEVAHFTSSAFVLNKKRTKMLVIYHKIYDSWGWTGGHSDGDSDLQYVAMKEAMEETGITDVKPILDGIFSLEIINVNGHIKKGKYVASHSHLNVTYLLEADEKQELRMKEDENKGVMWINIEDIFKYSTEKWIKNNIYAKIVTKMKEEKII